MTRPAREPDESALAEIAQVLDWHHVFEAMPDGVLVVDDAGVVRVANSRAGDLVGLTPRELSGRSIEELIPQRLRSVHREHVERYFRQPASRAMGLLREILLLRADGSECHVDVSLAHVRANERDWVVVSLRDVSDYFRLRSEVQHAHRVAEAASEEKSRFLTRMSHELRTPLHAMMGFAQLLEMEAAPHQRDAFLQIRQAGRHLLDLIGEVLDIARVESGSLGLSTESVQVSELLGEVLDLLQPIASERGVRFDARALDADSAAVAADRQRTRQILINLVSNAVKYNRVGGLVTFALASAGADTVRLEVRDSGVGIAEADLARLFQPFERLAAAGTEIEGTGVGLVLSQQLAEAMGGHIDASSTVGVGSVFSLSLPRARERERREKRPPRVEPARQRASRARGRLLYIEDNPSNVRLVEDVIARSTTWEVAHAANGTDGLARLRAGHFDAVLLDVHLPDVEGADVLRRVRADAATKDLAIIVLSADASSAQIERMHALGASAYLTKPVDVIELVTLLDEIVAAPPAGEGSR
jgi:PAS domain S-box-containing protein